MSNYVFTNIQRYAVYVAHNEKCYLCETPIDLKSMEVDHIIPEHLLKDSAHLAEVLSQFGLPTTFDLNSYANWSPTCRRCNSKKREMVFSPVPIILVHLQRATERAQKAKVLEDEKMTSRRIQNALNVLKRADEAGDLDAETKTALHPLVEDIYRHRQRENESEAILLTPVYGVVAEDELKILIRGHYGVGVRPKGENLHPSWTCTICGSQAWNGSRCVVCGQMDDD